jgi:hypothetical protein
MFCAGALNANTAHHAREIKKRPGLTPSLLQEIAARRTAWRNELRECRDPRLGAANKDTAWDNLLLEINSHYLQRDFAQRKWGPEVLEDAAMVSAENASGVAEIRADFKSRRK